LHNKTRHSFLLKGIICVILILSTATASFGSATNSDFLNIRGEAAILIDAQSGRILYSKNPDLLLPTGSMAKMMTEYLVLEAIHNKQFTWDEKIQISDYSFKVSQNNKLSNVPLRKDKTYSIKELYEAMAIYSASGATIALAERVSGSETAFVQLMNQKASELGMKDYQFVNSTGLNNKDLYGLHPAGTTADAENMMSARATATLAFSLIRDYPEVFRFSKIPKLKFQEGTSDVINMDNWNWMLPQLVYGYEGIDGLKTGSTTLAGYSFTGTAVRNDFRLISVVMKTDSYQTRFIETKKLLDYGFQNYSLQQILPAKQEFEVKIAGGNKRKTTLTNPKPLTVLVKQGESDLYTPSLKIDNPAKNKAVLAPVAKGTVVGRIAYNYKGSVSYDYLTETIKKMDGAELITTEAINKPGFINNIINNLTDFLGDIWSNIYNSAANKLFKK